MSFKSFKTIESKEVLTSLNAMSAVRALGGIALAYGMIKKELNPKFVVASAAVLAATDMEGSVYAGTKRFPKLQKALRITPSQFGRIIDPIADKVFGISIFAGGLVSGAMPSATASAILGTEIVTAATTAAVTAGNGGEAPNVSGIGKMGMFARCVAVGSYLGADAVESRPVQDVLMRIGDASSAAAVGMGAISCYQLLQQRNAEVLSPAIQ